MAESEAQTRPRVVVELASATVLIDVALARTKTAITPWKVAVVFQLGRCPTPRRRASTRWDDGCSEAERENVAGEACFRDRGGRALEMKEK